MHIFPKIAGAAAAVALLTASAGAPTQAAEQAGEWPSETIAWVVPFGAGGGTDRWSRIMASAAPDYFNGYGWHVRNRPGGSGIAGWKWLLERPADGHTIILNSSSPVIALALESKPVLDPIEDIKVCAFVSAFRSYAITQADSPYQTVDDVLKASEEGSNITVGGTTSNLLGQINFWSGIGADLTYVGYDGAGQVTSDVLGGHIDLGGVTGAASTGVAPEMATVVANTSDLGNPKGYEEAVGSEVPVPEDYGIEGISFPRWVGVHPDTPDAICKQISDSVGALLKDESVLSLLKRIKEQVMYLPMEEAQAKYESAVQKFGKAAKMLK